MVESPQSSRPKSNVNPQDLALRGWASPLAIFVSAFLVIEAITGLWIYLAPFSPSAQAQVLLHTLAGLLLVVPYLVYQGQHFLTWYRQSVTAVMILGYALGLMVLLCTLSGLVITYEASFLSRMSAGWDQVHLVTGIASLILILAHLILAFSRRRLAFARHPGGNQAFRRFGRQSALWLASFAGVLGIVTVLWPSTPGEMPLPEAYTLPDYLQEFDEYRGSPFAPTYARTAHGTLIDPDLLAHSESCGSSGCHEEVLAEWQPSAHRFSAMNPPFQQVQKDFALDRSPAETRYCAGCHDPISLFAGAKDIQNLDLSAPGMQEGISCVVCHSISEVDQRGNADYVLTAPQKYLWEHDSGAKKFVSDFLIRAYPRQHLADYDRNILRTPEFCGTCHKQFIPEALNRFGLSPGQNQYDEWRKGHWYNGEDPELSLSCRDCHMRLVHNSKDPGRGEAGDLRRKPDDEAHRHHGTIATNLYIPALMKLPHWEEQDRLTREWIKGETVIPEIAHLWPEGPVASLEIQGPEQTHVGEDLRLMVLVKNRKVGHNFSTGPLDFIRIWVHLTVRDASGGILAEWGGIDPETRRIFDVPGKEHQAGNPRDEGTLVLEGVPLDSEGQPLVEHELWRKAGGKGGRVIFPMYADKQSYHFVVPPSAAGPLQVTADLNFRRYRQEFLDLTLPTLEEDSGFFQPTVTKHSVTREIQIADLNRGAP